MTNGKSRIMLIIIALAVSLVVVLVFFANATKRLEAQIETLEVQAAETIIKHEALIETVEVLQRDDIQRLISYAKKVIAGEISIERGENPLSVYSYNSHAKELYPATDTIEMSLAVVEAHIDGDRGELRIAYDLLYLDSAGKKVRASSSSPERPSLWRIEKQGDDWVVVGVDDYAWL